jgi:hypothetical protein
MAAERRHKCADDHDEQLQHASIVAGVGAKIDGDEFWRDSGRQQNPKEARSLHATLQGPHLVSEARFSRTTSWCPRQARAIARKSNMISSSTTRSRCECPPKSMHQAGRSSGEPHPVLLQSVPATCAGAVPFLLLLTCGLERVRIQILKRFLIELEQ